MDDGRRACDGGGSFRLRGITDTRNGVDGRGWRRRGRGGNAWGTGAEQLTPSGPIPVGQARVTVTRPSSLLYAGVPASIAVDGKNVANVWPGSSATFDVPAGARVVTASAWSYPKEWTMRFDARAGAAYAIEVVPREASLGPTMILGPLAGVIDKDAQGNGGAFELRLVGG